MVNLKKFRGSSEDYSSDKKIEKKGVNVIGPLSADTFFISNFKKFNVVVGMYHDQVLIPVKTLFHFNAINVTLGLKYLRVSPDHGPGKDIIGKKRLIFKFTSMCKIY